MGNMKPYIIGAVVAVVAVALVAMFVAPYRNVLMTGKLSQPTE